MPHRDGIRDYSGQRSGIQNSKDDELIHENFHLLLPFTDRWSDVNLSMPEEIYDKLQGSHAFLPQIAEGQESTI